MNKSDAVARRYYFTTRDLLMMAILAGLGGVASTAINALGDVVQAVVGFAGTTQWAAGFHVVVLLLSVGLTRKDGSATVTGLLKGGVEMLSGNTHGLIILLVNTAAGLLIDLIFLALRRRRSLWTYALAGGIGAASNVFVFQLFASAPEDVLAFIWGITALAFASGVVFGGLLAHALLRTLHKSGVVPEGDSVAMGRWQYSAFLAVFAFATIGGGALLSNSLQGPPFIAVGGAVEAPYEFAPDESALVPVTLEVTLQGMKRQVTGVALRDVLGTASPDDAYSAVLVSATDGYSFFITRHEVETNEQLLLAYRGEGEDLSYEIAGAENSKAWVRNVAEIRAVPKALIEAGGLLENAYPYDPDKWQYEMDGFRVNLGSGTQKYQGVLLKVVLESWQPKQEAKTVHLIAANGDDTVIGLDEVMSDGTLRIWAVSTEDGLSFTIARENSEIVAQQVIRIEVD